MVGPRIYIFGFFR